MKGFITVEVNGAQHLINVHQIAFIEDQRASVKIAMADGTHLLVHGLTLPKAKEVIRAALQ